MNPVLSAAQRVVNWWYRGKRTPSKKLEPVEKQGYAIFPANDTYQSNWWQLGRERPRATSALQFSPVYACCNIVAQEIAKVPLEHWRKDAESKRRQLVNSAAIRVLNRPNGFQSKSDFFLYLALSYLLEGNGYCYVERSPRGDPVNLYPLHPRSCYPYVVPETGEIWYQCSQIQNYIPTLEPGGMVPQRNIIHVRIFCPNDPLIGESPLTAAMFAVSGGLNIESFSDSFFSREARPGGILRTAERLGEATAKKLAEMWAQATSGENSGRTAVLDRGLEWQPLTMTAVDAELVKQHGMKRNQIAEIYRVPLFMLGDYEKATFNNVETMTRIFYSSCLGFHLDHLENVFGDFFELERNDYFSFDIERSLMRPEFNSRMEGYARGVQGGVMAPNEARERENLPPVEGGDNAFLQAQMISVEAASQSQPQRSGDGGGAGNGGGGEPDTQEAAVRAEVKRQLKLINGGVR